jgi:hypothetical protein
MRPSLTQSRRFALIAWLPSCTDSSVDQTLEYDEASTLAHTNAASVAASMKLAPPVSVFR